MYWPDEGSVTTVPGQALVSPAAVGETCHVKTAGKVYAGRVATHGLSNSLSLVTTQ